MWRFEGSPGYFPGNLRMSIKKELLWNIFAFLFRHSLYWLGIHTHGNLYYTHNADWNCFISDLCVPARPHVRLCTHARIGKTYAQWKKKVRRWNVILVIFHEKTFWEFSEEIHKSMHCKLNSPKNRKSESLYCCFYENCVNKK